MRSNIELIVEAELGASRRFRFTDSAPCLENPGREFRVHERAAFSLVPNPHRFADWTSPDERSDDGKFWWFATDELDATQVRPSVPDRSQLSKSRETDEDFLLNLYLRDARREPLLTPVEETQLGWRACFGDETARQRLVLGNLRLVVHLAFQYRNLGLALADLIGEGNLGLLRAAELFDPARGTRFANYAALWMRKRMRGALANQSRLVRLPMSVTAHLGNLRTTEERLTTALGRTPQSNEVAAASGLEIRTLSRLRANGFQQYVSLETRFTTDEDRTLAETLPDRRIVTPDEALARKSDCEFVERLLTILKPREQRVIRRRFGLEDGSPQTLEEIGQALGLIRQHVHKIECQALGKLRQRAQLLNLTTPSRPVRAGSRGQLIRLPPAPVGATHGFRVGGLRSADFSPLHLTTTNGLRTAPATHHVAR